MCRSENLNISRDCRPSWRLLDVSLNISRDSAISRDVETCSGLLPRFGTGRGDIEFGHMTDMLAAPYVRRIRMLVHRTAGMAWQSADAVKPFAE